MTERIESETENRSVSRLPEKNCIGSLSNCKPLHEAAYFPRRNVPRPMLFNSKAFWPHKHGGSHRETPMRSVILRPAFRNIFVFHD